MYQGTISDWGDAATALRSAREANGLTLDDIAGVTRIPSWHLEAMELSRFDALPAPIFAVGFAKTFARAVGLPEEPVAAAVRNGLSDDSVAAPLATGAIGRIVRPVLSAALVLTFVLMVVTLA